MDKKKKDGIIIMCIVIVLVVIFAGLYAFSKKNDAQRNNGETNTKSGEIVAGGPNSSMPSGEMRPGGPGGNMPSGDMGELGGTGGPGRSSSNINSEEAKASIEVIDTQTLTEKYETFNADESVIRVSNGGSLTLEGATVSKTAGDSSNTEDSEFYGINSGILTTEGSTTTIKNSKITTNAKGANAVFATGENAKIYLTDTKIESTGVSSARGLDSTYGGYIEADNVTISTQGGSCATLATDRGEGTVIARNSNLTTSGAGSPIIYSTGDITVEKTTGVAKGAQMVVVEGKNTATVTDSTLKATGKGNRNDVDNCGVMIYQSMSQDAAIGTGTFNATDSTLEITEGSYYKSAPFFFITNTNAVINLKNTVLNYGSSLLLKIAGTSEWGTSGSNGGNVTFNATNQKLEGNIEVDSISTLTMNLTNGSSLNGKINNTNTAKSITLKLDSNSSFTLTGDCYITLLDNEDSSNSNINFNGYSLYVNGEKIYN